ncbi:MAG TPA: VOC family protein [Steroidobacteraceae bacterium]|nr:VOC family protein [Steroidobacteraceae bacterium]
MPKLIHAMIRVLDLDRSTEFYRRGFGLEESHRMEFPTFTLLYLREPRSGFEIELTWNKGQTEPYAHGAAYGHLAFCVEDLEGHRALMQRLGHAVGDLKELVAPNSAARFYFVTDPDGYKIEVLQQAGHYV